MGSPRPLFKDPVLEQSRRNALLNVKTGVLRELVVPAHAHDLTCDESPAPFYTKQGESIADFVEGAAVFACAAFCPVSEPTIPSLDPSLSAYACCVCFLAQDLPHVVRPHLGLRLRAARHPVLRRLRRDAVRGGGVGVQAASLHPDDPADRGAGEAVSTVS